MTDLGLFPPRPPYKHPDEKYNRNYFKDGTEDQ